MAEQQVLNDLLKKFGVDREWIERVGSEPDPNKVAVELERHAMSFDELVHLSAWLFVEQGAWEYLGDGFFRETKRDE